MLAKGHTPDAPAVTRALRVQGPELVELMLTGEKVVENRDYQIGLGWWVVVVGTDRRWREADWVQPFKAVVDTVPTDESLTHYHGHAVGLIHLSEYRAQLECHGYKWAGRDSVCHVISHAVKFRVPIKIKPPGGYSMTQWGIEPEEQSLLSAQLPDASPARHDLTPINKPAEDAALSSSGDANGAALLAAPLQSDTAPGEGYLDELAERIVDEVA